MPEGKVESPMRGSEEWLVGIFGLPSEVRVSQKIPKKTLMEMGAGGRGGKKLVQELIGELRWVASLQRSNTGLPGAKGDPDSTNEIEVIWGRVRCEPSRPSMLLDLTGQIHRSIPYPIVLAMTSDAGWVEFSIAIPAVIESSLTHRSIQERPLVVRLDEGRLTQSAIEHGGSPFRMGQLPRISVADLYVAWFDRLLALAISQRTGVFGVSNSIQETRTRYEALRRSTELEIEISALTSKVIRAKQLRIRSDLNLEIRQKTSELMECQSLLVGSTSERMD
jgi:hypothetical protein